MKNHLFYCALCASRYILFILFHIVINTAFDTVNRVKKMADGHVVVQGINDQSNIFTHIAVDIIWFIKKLRRLVYQVGGQQTCRIRRF